MMEARQVILLIVVPAALAGALLATRAPSPDEAKRAAPGPRGGAVAAERTAAAQVPAARMLPPTPAAAPEPAASAPLRLEILGIVRTHDGAVSVTLTDGEMTATIAVGEVFGALQLLEVSEGAITLRHTKTEQLHVRRVGEGLPRAPAREAVPPAQVAGPFPAMKPPEAGVPGAYPPEGISTPASLTQPPPQGFSAVTPTNLAPPQGGGGVAPTHLPPPQGHNPTTPSGTLPQEPPPQGPQPAR